MLVPLAKVRGSHAYAGSGRHVGSAARPGAGTAKSKFTAWSIVPFSSCWQHGAPRWAGRLAQHTPALRAPPPAARCT